MQINLIGTGAMYTAYNSACTLIDNKIIVDIMNFSFIVENMKKCKKIY